MFKQTKLKFNNKAQTLIHGAQMTTVEAIDSLKMRKAEISADKAVWLLRQSSSYLNQIAVSYYRHESTKHQAGFVHQRFGLTQEGWVKAPSPNANHFDEAMAEFNQSLISINPKEDADNKMPVLSGKVDELLAILASDGFNITGLMKPYYGAPFAFKITDNNPSANASMKF